MCSLDLDPCEFWAERTVTARVFHQCDGCGCLIEPGETYLRHKDIFEGDFSSEAMCSACWWIREDFAQAHGQSFAPSCLADQLDACGAYEKGSEWRTHIAALRKRIRRGARVHERFVGALAAARAFAPMAPEPLLPPAPMPARLPGESTHG